MVSKTTVFTTYREVAEENPKWTDNMVQDYLSIKEQLEQLEEALAGLVDSKTAFGELQVAQMEPITQISAQYGTFTNTFTAIDSGASGTTTIVDGKYTCQTGTAADGLSSILTSRQLAYRPGQGALARFTAVFTTGVANSQQTAGLITAENSFAFGYQGSEFGILYTHDGKNEAQELTLTIAAAGAGNSTVTIDGTPYVVGLTGGGTVDDDAYELAVALEAAVPNYTFTSNEATVVAQSTLPGVQGAFAYSSVTGSTGTWAQLTAGQSSITEFIPKTSWNTRASFVIDPTLGNVYEIQFQYLGFGAVNFYIEGPEGDFILVHQIKYPNTKTVPSVTNPTFRIGWLAVNGGNTTNLTVSGSSAAGFIEGTITDKGGYRAQFSNQPSVGLVLTNILSIRNRIHFGERINRAEIESAIVTFASQTNQTAFFVLTINPTFASNVVWEYQDKDDSIAEFTKSAVPVSGGRAAIATTVVAGSSIPLDLEQLEAFIVPGDVLCIAAQVSSGAASDMQASVTWDEEV